MRRILPLLLLCSCLSFAAKKLPEWTADTLANIPEQVPDTGVWVLLDQTVIKDEGDSFLVTRRLIKKVMRNWDTELAGTYIIDGDEEATKIVKLKGWHQKANGRVEKHDKDNVQVIGSSSIKVATTGNKTRAWFKYVAKGSIVVFESVERVKSFFPTYPLTILGAEPVLKKEIRFQGQGKLTTLGFEGWQLQADINETSIVLKTLPALRLEHLLPRTLDYLPHVMVMASRDDQRLDSWDNLAKWYADLFEEQNKSKTPKEAAPLTDPNLIAEVVAQAGEVRYRQRYLSFGRGWTPLPGTKVDTLKYGDCKDMSSFVVDRLARRGALAFPVLCGIANAAHIGPNDTPRPAFNHAIVAVALQKSLALPAEVTVADQLYLLYDPTDKNSPLGYLHSGHKNRNVLICTPSGARWARVPDAAIEEGSLAVNLVKGSLNRSEFTLLADLEIVERGDAYGFRTSATSDDPWDMEYHLRSVLELPVLVEMQRRSMGVEDGVFKASWRVRWRHFFTEDLDGLRLPKGLTGDSLPSLVEKEGRQYPIFMPEIPTINWYVNVTTDVVLTPAQKERNWQGAHRELNYKAYFKHKKLVIMMERKGQEALYSHEKIEEGLQQWQTYRNANNKLVFRDAMFYQ